MPLPKSSPGEGPPPLAAATAAQAPRIVSSTSARLIYRHYARGGAGGPSALDFEGPRVDRRQRLAAQAELEGAAAQAHPHVREVVVVCPDRNVDAERLPRRRVQRVHEGAPVRLRVERVRPAAVVAADPRH